MKVQNILNEMDYDYTLFIYTYLLFKIYIQLLEDAHYLCFEFQKHFLDGNREKSIRYQCWVLDYLLGLWPGPFPVYGLPVRKFGSNNVLSWIPHLLESPVCPA